MDARTLVEFLFHLMACTEQVIAQEEIERYDIMRLQRELDQLKKNITGNEAIDLIVLDLVLALRLKVDHRPLGDSKRSSFIRLFSILFHPAAILEANRVQRLDEVRRQLGEFRSEIDHIRFLLAP